jgi:hypothetical protein
MTTTDAVRAPRLTDKLLTEDLPVLLAVADHELEYLQSRLTDAGVGALHDSLRLLFKTKAERLRRSRDWLAGKLAAEAAHRSED